MQSLAAPDEERALATLRLGVELFRPERFVVALPWSSSFLGRFLALGPLACAPRGRPPTTCRAPSPSRTGDAALSSPTDATHPLMPGDHASEQLLQLELELGATVEVRALSPRGPLLSGWRRH